jgi:hypothetical protein
LLGICEAPIQEFRVGHFSTLYSTVGQNFAANLRNSARRDANIGLPKYLASATLCNGVKTSAKSLSRIMSPCSNR